MAKDIYINRELSWLDFNSRVLEEAADPNVPSLERLKFLAIFSSNLDEFFMVRVAGVNQQLESGINNPDPSGLTPEDLLVHIREKVNKLLKMVYKLLNDEILPQLAKSSFQIYSYDDLDKDAKKEIRRHFENQIFPVLTPVAVDPSHPFPILSNCSIEIAVTLRKAKEKEDLKAFVEVPQVLSRFVKITTLSTEEKSAYILLEDIILAHIDQLFVNCKIMDAFIFRITRDMDFAIDEEGVADLLHQIEQTLRTRKRRWPVRLEVLAKSQSSEEKWLIKQLGIPKTAVYKVAGPLDLIPFFELIGKEARPELLEPAWDQLPVPEIDEEKPVFDSIKEQGTIPLFHPFQKFEPVVRFLTEAANDPNVLAIKQTLYRVSGDSPVIHALQQAAENKKQVTVIVELKARFDEEKNIGWAKKLEESGAHVIYGIAGLKIHCKALLVIRKEETGIHRYIHLGTGNYNDKTATLYTDIGMFSDDSILCTDIASLFNIMTGYSEYQQWSKIATAPLDLRQKFLELIQREIRLSTSRNPGRIIAKMNSLVDPEIIQNLHKAAKSGVKIDLIVRGICCLKPNDKSENINITSIVDRYLEHSRIYYFENGGNAEYYLSSADWMPRNLDRRIELLFQVEDDKTRELIDKTLQLQLADKAKGRKLNSDGTYYRKKSAKFADTRSQLATYNLFKSLLDQTPQINKTLTIFTKHA